MNKIPKDKEIHEELQKISPLLAKMRQAQEGFKVPENYFDYLSGSVLEQIKLEPTPVVQQQAKNQTSWFAFLWKPRLIGSLATLALIVAIALFINQSTNEQDILAEITTQELEDYVVNHIEEFETDLFIDENVIEDISDVSLEEAEINQYLETVIDEIDEETLEQLL